MYLLTSVLIYIASSYSGPFWSPRGSAEPDVCDARGKEHDDLRADAHAAWTHLSHLLPGAAIVAFKGPEGLLWGGYK